MKFPFKLFKGRKGDDDEDEDFDEFEDDDFAAEAPDHADDEAAPVDAEPDSEVEPEPDPDAAPDDHEPGEDEDEFGGEEGDDDYDEDEDEDEEGRGAWARMDPQRKLLILGAAFGGLLFVGIIGGAGWFILGGSDEATGPKVPSATVMIPPAGGPESGALTPPKPLTPEGASKTAAAKEGGKPAAARKQAPGGAAGGLQPEAEVGGVSASQVALQNLRVGSLGTGAQLDPDRSRIVPFTTGDAYKGLKWLKDVPPLSRVPDPALVDKDGQGNELPQVARNGTRPMDAYARPAEDIDSDVPRVAILMADIGLSRAASLAAIKALPPAVSLVINPYSRDPGDWVLRARLAGHEVYLGLPLESDRFPLEDPGPMALNTSIQVDDNLTRLRKLMGLFPGYVGVVTMWGSKFGVAEGQLKAVLGELRDRGLLFVDGGQTGKGTMIRLAGELKLPRVISNMTIDDKPSASALNSRTMRLEALLKSQSLVVITAHPYPTTLRHLAEWLPTLESKNIRLIPVSAAADKQTIQ